MSNPIFNALGGSNVANPMQMLNQLMSNPVQFLASRRLNIPPDISNNPQAIVQHLLNSGQMSQDTYNKLQSRVSQMTRK